MNQKSLVLSLIALSSLGVMAQTQDNSKYARVSKNNEIYTSVMRELDINFVDTLNYDKISKDGIDAMLSGLDPYTVYIPESEESELKRMTSGEYAGIGAYIMAKDGQIFVSEPHEGMPAQRNDVRAGDEIISVDGKLTKTMSSSDVSELLRGIPGTEVTLVLKRPGEKRNIQRKFSREIIQVNPITYYGLYASGVGYIMLSEFTDKAYVEFRLALMDLVNNKKIESLIIDLRNNGGGIVNEAVSIAGLFLPRGSEVVSMKGRGETNNMIYKTIADPLAPNLPLTVLINSSSASASEILAGALQDYDRALLVGERSFGKGLVQSIRRLPYNGYVKLTTAKYYIPSGRCVQAIDYATRNADGSVDRIPDSLAHEFKTKNGRIVKDGGGVLPEIVMNDEGKLSITYYLYVKNIFFDYTTDFVLKHKSIPAPSDFVLSDAEYDDFVNYVKSRQFTYKLESERYLNELRKMLQYEGYTDVLKQELEALENKMIPQVDADMLRFKSDIKQILEGEICKRYYYQKGAIEQAMRYDKWSEEAAKVLMDKQKYNSLLGF